MGKPSQPWLNCPLLWVQLQPLVQLQRSSFLPLKHLLLHQILNKQLAKNVPAGFQVGKMYLYQPGLFRFGLVLCVSIELLFVQDEQQVLTNLNPGNKRKWVKNR